MLPHMPSSSTLLMPMTPPGLVAPAPQLATFTSEQLATLIAALARAVRGGDGPSSAEQHAEWEDGATNNNRRAAGRGGIGKQLEVSTEGSEGEDELKGQGQQELEDVEVEVGEDAEEEEEEEGTKVLVEEHNEVDDGGEVPEAESVKLTAEPSWWQEAAEEEERPWRKKNTGQQEHSTVAAKRRHPLPPSPPHRRLPPPPPPPPPAAQHQKKKRSISLTHATVAQKRHAASSDWRRRKPLEFEPIPAAAAIPPPPQPLVSNVDDEPGRAWRFL